MDSEVLIVIGAFVLIGALAIAASGSSIQTFGGMFRAPTLGWPSGVQEDDDLQWTWSPTTARPVTPPGADLLPDVQDIVPASAGLRLQPIRREVR